MGHALINNRGGFCRWIGVTIDRVGFIMYGVILMRRTKSYRFALVIGALLPTRSISPKIVLLPYDLEEIEKEYDVLYVREKPRRNRVDVLFEITSYEIFLRT